jgi:serine/threonine protein kinase
MLPLCVHASLCRLDGRKYAVKKIRLQPGGSSSSYSRILREVATLSRLQHPNVVRYYQVSSGVVPLRASRN